MEKYTILYDLTIVPEALSLDDVMNIKEKTGILFCDGYLGRKRAPKTAGIHGASSPI